MKPITPEQRRAAIAAIHTRLREFHEYVPIGVATDALDAVIQAGWTPPVADVSSASDPGTTR